MQSGSPPAEKIEMSVRHYEVLDREGRRQKISRHYSIRIAILLRASQGKSNKEIAREVGVAANTVRQWRSRWEAAFEALLEFEKGPLNEGVSDSELLEKMLEILSDRPRSGCPAHIEMEQKEQIRALACESPKDYGIIMDEWTHQSLAETAIEKGIVGSISATYVGIILKKTI